MTDPRMAKLADVLVNYSTRVKKGDLVYIEAGSLAAPLVRELVFQATKAGGNVDYALRSGSINEVFMSHASDEQLGWVSPFEMMMIKQVDVAIFISAPENTRSMSAIDPSKQQKRSQAFHKWHDIYMKRSADRSLRWTMANYPCHALAQEADMSLADYEDFVYKATFADKTDPVKAWMKVHDDQQKLVDYLAGKKEFHIRGVNADITMSIEGRTFINSDGDQNMPSGEVFTSPVENSATGWVNFTYPAIHMGREVEGIRLEYKNGRVVKATARKNEEYLLKMLDTDKNSRILGELGLGTNYGITKFSKDILFDEKIGGTFHLAVGSGFGECGGKNKSSLHWDMICDARKDMDMFVDGELFYHNGKFLV